jgi:hypothetical protein
LMDLRILLATLLTGNAMALLSNQITAQSFLHFIFGNILFEFLN